MLNCGARRAFFKPYFLLSFTLASLVKRPFLLITPLASSLVVARAEDADKIEEIKKTMFENINTRKWICVEADQLRVVSCKDIIMLVMVSSELAPGVADGMVEAFAEVVGGQAEVTDGNVTAALSGEVLTRG